MEIPVSEDDHIGQLPHDILIDIFSLLTIKEAARMSTLKRVWNDLWAFNTTSFEFDGTDDSINIVFKQQRAEEKSSLVGKYIDFVSLMLRKHCHCHKINKLSICSGLGSSYSDVINGWIKFAIEKKVIELKLDFSSYGLDPNPKNGVRYCYYSFPDLDTLLSLSTCPFTGLKSLELIKVHVSEDVVSYLLANCPLLESLSLVESKRLEYLKVDTLKLRHIGIGGCRSLKVLDISTAPNLVSFAYSGPEEEVILTSMSQLSELSLGGDYCQHFVYYPHSPRYTSYIDLSHLQKLKLSCPLTLYPRYSGKFHTNFPDFDKLKELEISTPLVRETDMMFMFTHIIHACPALSHFKMQFIGDRRVLEKDRQDVIDMWHYIWMAAKLSWETFEEERFRPKHIKQLELVGFIGDPIEFELAKHLLKLRPCDQFIVDTRHPPGLHGQTIRETRKINSTTLELRKLRAKELEIVLPPTVELVIL